MSPSNSRFFCIDRKGKLVKVDNLEAVLAEGEKGGYIWLDYFNPAKEDLLPLIDKLDLHPLAIEDCLDENQIPKIDDFPQHAFILFNAFAYKDKMLASHEVDIFIGKNFVVTVHGVNTETEPLLEGIERSIAHDVDKVRQGPAFLAHIILDYIVDQKLFIIESIEEELADAEDAVLEEKVNFDLAILIDLRRSLLTLRKSLFHEREVLVKICRKDSPYITGKVIYYYRDIYDHLVKFFELIESARDIVTSLMEMRLAIINNHMTQAANLTNKTVRRLTTITTIFMPLSLIAGIGGMSEYTAMTGAENMRSAYIWFMVAMVIIAILNYFLLKWYEKRDLAQAGG
jgi:magnesium transporter